MKIKTVDQRIEELKGKLIAELSFADLNTIKSWLIQDRNEVTLAKVRKNFNTFNSAAQL